jgi:predicted ATPase
VDPEQPLRKTARNLEGEIEDRAPERIEAMPLLNVVLDLHIPENEFTQNLEPKIRQSALHALLVDCLKAAAQDEPLLIVVEDVHWIDALSHDLLEQLARALADYAVCFVLAYRPPQLARLEAPRIEALPQFTHIKLHELTPAEAESAIRAKLAQLYPDRGGATPSGLVDTLMARSQGNPFYLEELLNYVRDRGLDPADIENIELPNSLHALILSRIDQLSEHEKTILRVASVVGRLFRVQWLTGYYPELGPFPAVKAALDTLSSLDITPLDSPAPECAYLFKHIITHEATYESLPFAIRAKLHERLARYLENVYPDSLPLEVLAFHYGRSDNQTKQMEYLRKAGEAAQKNFANEAALDFYGNLLPLLTDAKEEIEIHLQRGEVYELMGNYDDAERDYRAALAFMADDTLLKARAQFALGKLSGLRGDYESALDWLGQAQGAYAQLQDSQGLAQALSEMGKVWWRQGNYIEARERLNEGLALAQETGDIVSVALALNNLGLVAWSQGDYAAARALYEESLSLRRELGDKRGISGSLGNLGIVAADQGDYAAAQSLYEESLSLVREMGDKQGISSSLNNLGLVAVEQGDFAAARALYEESLSLRREMGDKPGISHSLNNLGIVAWNQGDYAASRALHEESLNLCREMGDKWGIAASLSNLGDVTWSQGDYAKARLLYEEGLSLLRELGDKWGIAFALNSLGKVSSNQGDYTAAHTFYEESLSLRREIGNKQGIVVSLGNLGNIAFALGDYAAARAFQAESLALGKELEDKTDIAYALLSLGLVDLAENNPEAREQILESLRLQVEMGKQLPQTSNLVGVAGLAWQEGDATGAAQWLGAVASALTALDARLEFAVKQFHAQTLTAVRAQLGEAAFQSAWAVGAEWRLEEAVQRALVR